MPQGFFLRWGQIRIAQHMDNTTALDDTVRANHLCYGHHRGDLHDGDTGLLEFGRDRSAAASGRASRGGQNDRINPLLLELLSDLTPQPTTVGKRIG